MKYLIYELSTIDSLRYRATCLLLATTVSLSAVAGALGQDLNVKQVLDRVRSHTFHPLAKGESFTVDRKLGKHGVANLRDTDGRVRLLAIRDLVMAGTDNTSHMIEALRDPNIHVRQVVAASLGILSATEATAALMQLLQEDPSPLVRSQAAISLGQMASRDAQELLRERSHHDPSRDVRHQCELAVDRIEKGVAVTGELREAYRSLDPQQFATAVVGQPPPDFTLPDTEGREWSLSDFRGKHWVALIWVFADWCPVCHGEFHELIEMREAFEEADVQVMTIECHDMYRCRVMVGKELEPNYWFAKQPFQELYTREIWWPHLVDRAGVVGSTYGAEPLAFAVHAEYINRPSTILIDPTGRIRFMYHGTFWGDRPSIRQTLEMIQNQQFEFEHPKRLEFTSETAAETSS